MIKIDMQLPKSCGTCFSLDERGDYPFCLISREQMGYTFNVNACRMPHCPLKEENIVRCKDCKYCEYPKSEKEWCKKGHLHRKAEMWFCADGERR